MSTDTGTLRVHDGTTAGGRPTGLSGLSGLSGLTIDAKDYPSPSYFVNMANAVAVNFAPAIAVAINDTRTADRNKSLLIGVNPPKFIGQRLTICLNRFGNSLLPAFSFTGSNIVFDERYLDQPELGTYTLDGTGGFTTATGRALSTGSNSPLLSPADKVVVFDLVGIRYPSSDNATSAVLSWLVVGTTLGGVDAAKWVIVNYGTV